MMDRYDPSRSADAQGHNKLVSARSNDIKAPGSPRFELCAGRKS
jgi:hypothetical protein